MITDTWVCHIYVSTEHGIIHHSWSGEGSGAQKNPWMGATVPGKVKIQQGDVDTNFGIPKMCENIYTMLNKMV
jgi:hypothetical protein